MKDALNSCVVRCLLSLACLLTLGSVVSFTVAVAGIFFGADR